MSSGSTTPLLLGISPSSASLSAAAGAPSAKQPAPSAAHCDLKSCLPSGFRPTRLVRLLCIVGLFVVCLLAVGALLHRLAAGGSLLGGDAYDDELDADVPHRNRHHHYAGRKRHPPVSLDVRQMSEVTLENDDAPAGQRQINCSHWDCFDVYRCGHGAHTERMSVYVYPLLAFVDRQTGAEAAPLSREFHRVLQAIRDSVYYTANAAEACVFVPSVDLLNQNRFDGVLASKALASLEFWNNGENHLLFNMVPGIAPHYNTSIDVRTDRAMIAGAGFDTWTYRRVFDLSIPFYKPGLSDARPPDAVASDDRPFLLIAGQLNLYSRHNRILQELAYDHQADVLVLQECSSPPPDDEPPPDHDGRPSDGQPERRHCDWRCSFPGQRAHRYPDVLVQGRFCLIARGMRLVPLNLMETMAAGCVPVFMADNLVLPFDDVLDWTLASVSIRETNLHALVTRLQAISAERWREMRAQVEWLHARYFGSLELLVQTTLDHLNDRVFPHNARDQRAWNDPVAWQTPRNPLFLAMTAERTHGFTAVILTYDRVESLFTLIEKLAVVPSLHKILVVWNNQKKAPPRLAHFPKIDKPLQVIRTQANKLSNRFYPYAEIETEAILTIDDDINMLTADELDFGFEVWREFPDRIVGFPSRTHVWDNATARWRYESEWTNEISMVLTGAAFHHKYWSHMYTTAMPGEIKQWVDEHMNCEDIAMNFLVANITGQPPIKVAPRKKFKCPECTNTEMLSADLNHMVERSACIDRFARIYGGMPLRSVEFRADPVLYKDNFPEKLKRFNDIGSL